MTSWRRSSTERCIGRGDSTQYPFRGAIDEVTIYDRALTDAEIATIAAQGTAGKCK